jgi:DUF4097 and DUF4098 domain-containing protein YvlB
VRAWDKPEVKIVARKRAPSSSALERLKVGFEMVNGRVTIRTGVRVGESLRRLPSGASPDAYAIDLTIDAPRQVALSAHTFTGDIDASGFRAGAALRSEGGEVTASDIDGAVRTNTLKGRQRLASIRGDVEADGVTGDLDLVAVDGQVLVARVVDGRITAREVRSPTVTLLSTSGGVVLIGSLRVGGHYKLTALDGDVRLKLKRGAFSLDARAPKGMIKSAFPLPGAEPKPVRFVGDFQGGGPKLELSAESGNVLLETD